MDSLNVKTNNQLYGRLGYIKKVCGECDFDYCGGCPHSNEIRNIEKELDNRKCDSVERFIKN